jgi:hypothetical protein
MFKMMQDGEPVDTTAEEFVRQAFMDGWTLDRELISAIAECNPKFLRELVKEKHK